MSLENFYYISQIIASFAVLASLIYLALQTRQTSKNQRALMNQGVVNRASDTIHWLCEPRMLDLNSRVQAGEAQFTMQELALLQWQLRALLLSAQDVLVQHKAGLVDQITMDNNLVGIKSFLSLPVNRALWKSSREGYAPELIAWVERLIEAAPLAKPLDAVARFNTHLAEVMG